MLSRLERTKIYIEIVAIIGAGLFAFFTWGVNYISLSEPNWDLELRPDYQLPAIEVNGVNNLCQGNPTCIDSATGCVLGATLKILNKGNKAITPGKTNIDVYFIKRFKLTDTVNNNSPYEYFKETCESGILKPGCIKPSYSFIVDEIDPRPIYPGNEGWRPFSVEITPSKLGSTKPLVDFTNEYVLLFVIKQSIKAKKFIFWKYAAESKLIDLSQNVCGMRNYKEPKTKKLHTSKQ